METALTTDPSLRRETLKSAWRALAWRSWRESRARFAAAFVLLTVLVVYGVVTAPGYIARHNAHFPDKPLPYSVYVWSGFFHYALQGLWVLAAFVLTLGGLAREIGTGTALFTLGLPLRRSHLCLGGVGMVWAQSIALGVGAALLIPLVSLFAGEWYPLDQAMTFGALMSFAGLVILALGLLLSEIFEGEFTTPVVGLCAITTVFFSYKAHIVPGWNVFDVMSAAACVDPGTQLLHGTIPWAGLAVCVCASLLLLICATFLIQRRDA
jgi:ABC-type transport system involved in multi-copper enzyme maturation permease subunit